MDDYRFEEHGGGGRTSRAPGQQGSGDEFPPLGLGDGEMGQQSRRGPIGQGSQFGGLGAALGYGDASSQARSGLLGQIDTQRDSSAVHQGTRIMSPTDTIHRRMSSELLWLSRFNLLIADRSVEIASRSQSRGPQWLCAA